MSRASMAVRFPDGEVRWGVYEGTSDVYAPWLYPSLDAAWADSRSGERSWDEPTDGDVVDVEVWSGYGYGWVVRGTAAKNRLVTPMDWDDAGPEIWTGDGPDDLPPWVKEALR